jgi:hypothetical protein
MRSLIKLLIVLVLCLVGIGLYRGWFSFSRTAAEPKPDDNRVNVNLSVDKGKIKSDIKKAEDTIKGKLEGKPKPKEVK